MTIEELMDLQEAGAQARVRGLPASMNPYIGVAGLQIGVPDNAFDDVAA